MLFQSGGIRGLIPDAAKFRRENNPRPGSDQAPRSGTAPDPLPRSDLYRSLLAEERTPPDLRKAGYVTDWSALHFYKPARILKPKTESEIREALGEARTRGLKVCMAGTRHSMGGQAMRDDALFLDMTEFRGAEYNPETKTVTVKSGTNWIDLQNYLQEYGRTVRVKQASSVFSIGGSISSNIHGEDYRFGTIGNTVRSLRIMLADGRVVNASRNENPELFSHAVGGYGLFGIILEAELDTTIDEKYSQQFQVVPTSRLPEFFKEKVEANPDTHFFLTELSISPGSFLNEALVNTWTKVPHDGGNIPPFNAGDKSRLHVLMEKIPYVAAMHGPVGKAVCWALEKYLQPLLMQKYVSRNDALTLDYDMIRIPARTHTQVLQELFVPRERYAELIRRIRAIAARHNPNVVYASTRFVKKDTVSALPFARTDSLSMVIYRDEKLEPGTEARMESFYREAGDAATALGGTFYLTYQLPYTKEQVRKAYPGIDRFFQVKRKYDPGELFVNALYEKYGHA